MMHESFQLQDPTRIYTRDSFGWANALFAELVASNESILKHIIPTEAMPTRK
jgi:meiotically up-regulated gene 157 (Mug157) protein